MLAHAFRTAAHSYVYDASTNRIVQIEEPLYALITQKNRDRPVAHSPDSPDHATWHDTAGPGSAIQDYRTARGVGLLSPHRPAQVGRIVPEQNPAYATQLRQLTLEVTEHCNLRCAYCTYSGQYEGQRGHSTKRMTPTIAHKAIDYFLDHSGDTHSPAITFYGGEPLMHLRLIAACCASARKRADAKVRFQLTTNGTYLTPHAVDELVELDMFLVVSVDGPQACHDANRRTRTGHGSWDAILQNLRWFRSHYPDFYGTHVGVNCVLAPNASPLRAWDFFDTNKELFGTGVMLVTLVSDRRTDYWNRHRPSRAWWAEIATLRTRYYESLITGENRSRFLDALFQRPFLTIQRREIARHAPSLLPLNASCTPGVRRLFVDCDGYYHMCERIHRQSPIGHVDRGIDLGAIEMLCRQYRDVANEHCPHCWLFRFCPKCFASADITNARAFAVDCDSLRHEFSKTLENYCRLAELNPFAFRFMEDIVVS